MWDLKCTCSFFITIISGQKPRIPLALLLLLLLQRRFFDYFKPYNSYTYTPRIAAAAAATAAYIMVVMYVKRKITENKT